MTTEQELNEKLLKFAGAKPDRSPDGEYYYPDFIYDIAACLEYLGPKFLGWNISYEYNIYKVELRTRYDEFFAHDVTSPAMAFCLAVEQMIDKMEAK